MSGSGKHCSRRSRSDGDINKLGEEFIRLGEEYDDSIVVGGPYRVYCLKYYNNALRY